MNDRVVGRAAFLGILGAGLVGLAWGKQVSAFAGRFVPDQLEVVLPTKGWRIFTIRGIPRIDLARYRL
ncbi:MAG TPA: hypothetical protein VI503_00695, partial [Gaiellaceae bacterium]|nr:hypothetical protein [Gaiellaceae bacterium]